MSRRLLTLSKLAGAMALASAVVGVPIGAAWSDTGLGIPVAATIMRSGATASKIARITSVPSIGVINLRLESRRASGFRSDESESIQSYRVLAERNATGVSKLRAALRANPVTRRALGDHGVSLGRVVAVDVGSSGSLRVYVL